MEKEELEFLCPKCSSENVIEFEDPFDCDDEDDLDIEPESIYEFVCTDCGHHF
ncbi:MAG: hypothetical protein LBE91_08165 [Tannerella sp.]|jgi:predicted RNA-binding Zn-ribbon protein involved in translation (DUF1610 family)|nr:hypothetical protein [Tannerella sp.]